MKKLLIITLLFQSLACFAPGLNSIFIPSPDPITRVCTYTEKLQAIIWCESKDGENRYNPNETEAVGILQIWPVMVAEVNRILGYKKYQLSDRLSDKKSIEMFEIYQQHYNPSMNFEIMTRIWCSGPDGMEESNSIKYYKLALSQLYQI
jgi:hypothetical protein